MLPPYLRPPRPVLKNAASKVYGYPPQNLLYDVHPYVFLLQVTLLFQPWMIMSWPKYYIALVGVFLFCILHEWFTTYRTALDAELRPRSKTGTEE